MKALINKAEIAKVIPHRHEMFLVEEIVEIKENHVIGRMHLKKDDWYFRGHFPDEPIFPGVLMIELAAQVGAVKLINDNPGIRPYMVGVDGFRIRRKAKIGDTITVCVERVNIRMGFGKAGFVGKNQNEEEIFSGELIFAAKTD